MLRRAGLILAATFLAAAPAHATSVVVPTPAPTATPVPIKRWEYKQITYNRVALIGDSETELRLLGLQGWELVSAFYDPNARTIVCFLKRPVN